MILTALLLLAAACGWAAQPGQPLPGRALPVLARIGPWPVVSQFAAYDGRLWFANSVKGVNHNSADLYTYDAQTGGVRYERHLFSQDAGDPLVADGLLYWPSEDSRYSLGWGQFAVTEGRRWRVLPIPTASIFHTHAMVKAGGRLVAATSAWRGGFQESRDGGLTWRKVYDHPTQRGRVSRIVSLATLHDQVFGYIKERRGGRNLRRLLLLEGDAVTEVPGWPRERPLLAMVAFASFLYGALETPQGTAVWRTDGRRSERMAPPRPHWNLRGMAAGHDGLWAVTAGKDGGRLWFSRGGANWRVRHTLSGGRPHQVTVYGGRPYVGGAGADGRGILWGPPVPAPNQPPEPRGKLPRRAARERVDWDEARRKLREAVRDLSGPGRPGAGLRDLVYGYALAAPPPELFSEPLSGPLREREVALIGGNARVSEATLARWILLWGIGLSGRGRVPVELLAEPWRTPPNRPQKYFQNPPAAMHAAALAGQADRRTIAALIARLRRKEEPLWLKGDAVGALTALTGRRFAYDFAAWRKWWGAAEPSWPH
ncbi:MAG: PQQ-binding-like beta-propeller repeat protein [SAR324 cluster bacterium]|nr:PQQ-binding-like beta-propeller repeat protein [SAR324 cluster bacterium]